MGEEERGGERRGKGEERERRGESGRRGERERERGRRMFAIYNVTSNSNTHTHRPTAYCVNLVMYGINIVEGEFLTLYNF